MITNLHQKSLVFFAILSSIFFLNIQENIGQNTKKGFEISFKTGLTLANQYGKDADSETFLNGDTPKDFYANHPASTKIKAGFNIGGLIEYRFNKRISLGFGVNYIQKGTRINANKKWNQTKNNYDKVTGNIKWHQNYWNIDLPLKVYFPLKKDEIHLLGGITFGFLQNSEEKGSVKIAEKKYDYTNERGANENEQGFLLGFGYNYQLAKKNHLTFEFIWNRSLVKSFGEDLVPTSQSYYNQTFNLCIGYKFDFTKKTIPKNNLK